MQVKNTFGCKFLSVFLCLSMLLAPIVTLADTMLTAETGSSAMTVDDAVTVIEGKTLTSPLYRLVEKASDVDGDKTYAFVSSKKAGENGTFLKYATELQWSGVGSIYNLPIDVVDGDTVLLAGTYVSAPSEQEAYNVYEWYIKNTTGIIYNPNDIILNKYSTTSNYSCNEILFDHTSRVNCVRMGRGTKTGSYMSYVFNTCGDAKGITDANSVISLKYRYWGGSWTETDSRLFIIDKDGKKIAAYTLSATAGSAAWQTFNIDLAEKGILPTDIARIELCPFGDAGSKVTANDAQNFDLGYVGFFTSIDEAAAYSAKTPVSTLNCFSLTDIGTITDYFGTNARSQLTKYDTFVRFTQKNQGLTENVDYYNYYNLSQEGSSKADGDYFMIRYRTNAQTVDQTRLIPYDLTTNVHGSSEDINFKATGEWETAIVNVSSLRATGYTHFRLEFMRKAYSASDYFDIAFMGYFSSEKEAKAFGDSFIVPEIVYTDAELRPAGDASTSRVNMKGDNHYTTYTTKVSDPYVFFAAPTNTVAGNLKYIVVKYRLYDDNTTEFKFHYSNSGNWTGDDGVYVPDGGWNYSIVEIKGTLTNTTELFRFDVFDGSENIGYSVDVASVAIFKTKADAQAYANDPSLISDGDSQKYTYTVNSVKDKTKYLYGEYGNYNGSDRVAVMVGDTASPVFLPLDGGNIKVFDIDANKSSNATISSNGAPFYVYEKVADTGAKIPAVKAWLIDDWGSVALGATGVSTGAYLKVWSGDNVFDVPVTTDMLYDKDGNKVSTATKGVQKDLVVKYLDVEIYDAFTLNVVEAKDFITSNVGVFKLVDPIDPHGNVSKSIKNNTQYMLMNSSESGYGKAISLQFAVSSGSSCGVVPRSSYIHEIEVDGEKQYYVVPTGGSNDVWTTEFASATHPKISSLGNTVSTFFYLKSSSNTYLRYTGTGPATTSLQNLNAGWLPVHSTLYAQALSTTDSGFFWCEMPETAISTKLGNATVVKGSGLACFGTTVGLKVGGANDTGIADGTTYQEWRGLHYANEINNFTTRNPVDGYITANANMTPYDRVFYYEKDTSVTKMTVYVDKTDVAIGYGAAGADVTGANLVITTHKADGTFSVSRVPVTMDMLSTSGTNGKTAVSTTSSPDEMITFQNIDVTYQDINVGKLDTLTITAEEKGKPAYPNPGSVIITKELDTATHNYNKTGAARIELSVTGVPVSSGADVVIAIDNSGSMDSEKLSDGRSRRQAAQEALKQALSSFAKSGKDIAVSVVTFDGYDLIDAGYVLNGSRYNVTSDGKVNTSTYRVDTNCDSNLEPDTAQFLTAGFNSLIPDLDDRFVEIDDLTDSKINSIASNYINAGGGTNYDRGLELAYETLNARQKQNALEGKKRDSYLILMGDGDSLQYNYLGISGDTRSEANGGDAEKNQAMLKGELDDGGTYNGATYIKDVYGASSYASKGYNVDHTGTVFSSLATHPYYDTHYNKYGASWMAEAIKGDTDKKYMVIDPDADPKDEYLTYVNGLGATVYTIGFGVLSDSQISNMQNFMNAKKATGYVTGEVLRKISSDFDLEYAKSVVSDGKIIKDQSLIYSDNQYTYFTVTDIGGVFKKIADKISVAGDAKFTDVMSEYVDLQTKKATDDDVAPVIYVTEYETYKYSEIDTVVDGVYVTAELVGKVKKGYESGTIIEKVTFSADGSSATSNKLTGEIISDNKINANTFTYDMSTETFEWNVGVIPENKLVLSFDITLTQQEKGTYPTNKDTDEGYGAKLTYVDVEGNPSSEEAPTPTLPWGGFQVSYGFYLVDETGSPITSIGGKPVAFDLAYKVKDRTLYNSYDNGETATLDPSSILPSGFALYDPSAKYIVKSNQDGTGNWTITKDSSISKNTTYVTQFSSGGITSSNELSVNDSAYSYANTVVWFAVVLSDEIRGGESVVIDYGLPVDINVVADNKAHYDKVVALAQSSVNGNYSGELGDEFCTKDADSNIIDYFTTANGKFGTAAIKDNAFITYTPNTMKMNGVDVFTYAVERKAGEDMFQTYAYETLTVIPAANIYYEDAFIDFATYKNEKGENDEKIPTENAWIDVTDIEGTEGSADLSNNLQDQDRPGKAISEIGNDADNVYGFDSRYENFATLSLGSAKKITVDGSIFGEAKFTFKGTGFDIISLTSDTTGAIVVQIKGIDGNNANVERNLLVDTYYGYSYKQNDEGKWEWVVGDTSDALYQIPVIKVDDLVYGTYEVTVLVSHISYIDKTTADGYDFYLDAVRIYDPAGIYDGVTSDNNQTIEDAYKNDNEAWPEYTELRNVINAANEIQSSVNNDGTPLAGSMFIDGCPTIANADSEGNYGGGAPAGKQQWVNYLYFAGRYEYERNENVAPAISDYINYGPNNETYLAEGQAIAFTIDADSNLASVQIGLKAAKGATKINIYGVEKDGDGYEFTAVFNAKEINSATELYYDITKLAGKTVVIMNAGDGKDNTNPILSITNIKRTYKAEPQTTAETPKANGIYIDTATVELALASFATVEVPAFEPDTFNVSVSKSSVKAGKTVTVTVKTSSDVDYITVNGEEVTKYKRSLFSRQRTWTYTVKANKAGEFPIDVVAYSADDIASDTVTKIINVTATQPDTSVGGSSSSDWFDKWFGGIFGKK